MANRAPKKNKPGFFSLLLTLLVIAAGVFGVYKVHMIRGDTSIPAFLQEKSDKTSGKKDTTKPADEATTEASNATETTIELTNQLAKADKTLTAAMLAYCAENFDEKTLQSVLDGIKGEDYDREIWYTATGNSIYALQSITSGEVEKGTVKDTGAKKGAIRIGFGGKVNLALADDPAAAVSEDLRKVLSTMDIAVLNNDCTLTPDGQTAAFKANAKAAKAYETLGVDAVAIANAHINDYGAATLGDTTTALEDAGVAHIGAGSTVNEAAKPAYFLAGGRKIAFMSAAGLLNSRNVAAATADRAGVFSLSKNLTAVTGAVKAIKDTCDYVFVYISAGIDENASWFDGDQDRWSKALIDAGADGVIGAHSNRLQGMEFYKGKLIVYGLGNFLFDSATRETAVYQLTIGEDGTFTHTLLPCTQQNSSVALCTTDADKSAVAKRVTTYCGNVVKIASDGTITNNRR